LVAVTWLEALKAAAEGLKRFPAEQVGAFAGPRLSNEAAWQLTRLVRSTLGSGNLEHRHGALPRHPLTATLEGLDTATAVVVVGCDPTSTAPVLDLRIKKALRLGAGLVIVGADTGLDDYADVKLASLDELQQALEAHVEPGSPEGPPSATRPWRPGWCAAPNA
jgi:NADH-quinone oxidoreductase subunit G